MGLRGRLVCAAVGLVLLGAGGWLAVSEPVDRLAPEWVADPDGAPRTPDRAVTTGWFFLVLEVLLVLVLPHDRRTRRQVDRARRC